MTLQLVHYFLREFYSFTGDQSERQRHGSHPTLQRTQEVVEDDENDEVSYTGS